MLRDVGWIEDPYLRHLRGLPGVKSLQVIGPATQRQLRLVTRQGKYELDLFDLKTHLTHDAADRLIGHGRRPKPPVLLLVPHVGGPMGERLRAAGIHYLDRQGNCHIELEPGLLLHVEGKTAPKEPAGATGIRSAGYQVLFSYLAKPGLVSEPVRAVEEVAGASRQAVSTMRRRLVADGYVAETKSGFRWIPSRMNDALALWLHGYQTTVRPGILLGTYRTADRTPEELEERLQAAFTSADTVAPVDWRWGGSAAGFRMTGHFRGEKTAVHVHSASAAFVDRLQALPDARGALVLLDAFGTISWEPDESWVHPLLVYSEMLAEGSERAREAAQMVFERNIRPAWEESA